MAAGTVGPLAGLTGRPRAENALQSAPPSGRELGSREL